MTGSPAVLTASPSLPKNLGWSVLKNTSAQGVGRILIGLSRLVIAGIIVRSYGALTFAQYSLVFSLMAIAEMVADFGTTEIFVREICREPDRRLRLLRVLTGAKAVQIPLAYVVLIALVLALRYPQEIIEATAVGGLALALFGGVLVYRVQFKASLTMEREIAAEFLSVLVMVPLIGIASAMGAGLTVLVGCHVVSRAAYAALSYLFGRREYTPSVSGVRWPDITRGLRQSAAVGTIGLLVGVYEAIPIVLLSKFDLSGVAYYVAAQRLVWPVLMVLAAIGATMYPVLASYWPAARRDFERTLQGSFNSVLVLAGLMLCSFLAGPTFFMGLLGPEIVTGAPVLLVLALLCFAKTITSTVAPVLYIAHAQRNVLRFVSVAVVAKALVLTALAPRFGYLGVAYGAVAVELLFATLPAVYLLQRATNYRIRWNVAAKVAVLTTIAAGPLLLSPVSGFPAAVIAPTIYFPMAFLSRAVRVADLRTFLRWRAT